MKWLEEKELKSNKKIYYMEENKMNKKYSKVYNENDSKYRYNYDTQQIERIYFDEETQQIEVVTAIGLNKEDWKGDNKYWISAADEDMNEEISCLVDDFIKYEMGGIQNES